MENEAREITYLSIGLVTIAIVLTFITFAMTVTRNIAQARNEEIKSTDNIEQYREYNAYDGKTLIGDEIIELIRYKYNSGIDIFIDYRHNISTGETVSTNETCDYCRNEDNHRIYNLNSYLSHVEAPSDYNYFLLAQNAISAERNDMRNWYPSESKYRVYLVYNTMNVEAYYTKLMDSYYLHKDEFTDDADGKFEAIEMAKVDGGPSDIVTGIVAISYETLDIK